MKRMIPFAIAIVIGFALSAWILRREIRRAPVDPSPAKTELGAVDRWQRSIRLGSPVGHQPKTGADRELMEKLRREEERQRPQEGRN